MKAVIYARYSSNRQREESIEDQLRVCNDYAKREGYTVIEQYCDYALTGTNDNRPAFQKMVTDSAQKGFEAVIVYKVNRFARDRLGALTYRLMLKKNKVRLVSATESIPDTPEGILMESILDAVAEMESLQNAQGVLRAFEGNALKCKPTGVTVFGYKIVDKDHYEIDEVTAPLVRMAFEGLAAGKSNAEVCAELNATGVKTRRGNKWGKTNLQHIVQNEKYTGVYMFMGHRVEGGMPAIIDKDLFERVQNRKKRVMSRAHEYALTGKIYCGECGERMLGTGGTSHTGKNYYYYSCIGHINHNCDKKSVSQEALESDVIKRTLAILNDDETVNYIADNIMDYQNKLNNLDTLKHLESRRKKIEGELNSTEDLMIKMGYSERLAEKYRGLEAELAEIGELISAEAPKTVEITRDFIIYWMEQFRNENVDDPEASALLLKTFVSKVRLYDSKDYYEIEYNYSDANGNHMLEQGSYDGFLKEVYGGMYGT